jgi:tetratricopeptide (TPR) repeat protein
MELPHDAHREFARQANGRVWQLLEQASRLPDEQAEVIEAAYASLFHWRFAGSAVHRQRGLWLIARVHTVLGDSAQALKFATACLECTSENKDVLEDFDLAYAYEGIARAMALAGQHDAARGYFVAAREAGKRISDAEDRDIFMTDLEAGEWYGIAPQGPAHGPVPAGDA